jgi:hypothetical protein
MGDFESVPILMKFSRFIHFGPLKMNPSSVFDFLYEENCIFRSKTCKNLAENWFFGKNSIENDIKMNFCQ